MKLSRGWHAADRRQREQRRQRACVTQGSRHGGCKDITTNVIRNETTITKHQEKKQNRYFSVGCDATIPDTGIAAPQSMENITTNNSEKYL